MPNDTNPIKIYGNKALGPEAQSLMEKVGADTAIVLIFRSSGNTTKADASATIATRDVKHVLMMPEVLEELANTMRGSIKRKSAAMEQRVPEQSSDNKSPEAQPPPPKEPSPPST